MDVSNCKEIPKTLNIMFTFGLGLREWESFYWINAQLFEIVVESRAMVHKLLTLFRFIISVFFVAYSAGA